MACILLDVDGVLHVSGEPIPGRRRGRRAAAPPGPLAPVRDEQLHPSAATLAEELRGLGFELDDDELQTTPRAAARELAGKRVFALVMGAIVPDLEGIELVGDHADAVLLGGCDETTEPNQVFSWMNLGRAFAELQMGAELYCLHKNKWWQTSRGPLLDAGAFVAGLEYATGVDATVLGKPSAAYFAAALDALGAEPELTWMVTDDLEADVRGAQSFGMRTALVRTGKFRPETLEGSGIVPEIVLSSVAQFPDWLERSLVAMPVKIGTDLIEIERIVRALERPGFRDRCFTQAEQEYCETRRNPAESYAARFCGKEAVGKALGCGVRFTWKDIEIVGPPKPGVTLTGRTAGFAERVGMREIDVSLTHSHTMAGAACVVRLGGLTRAEPGYEPLCTAAEMRAAEEAYPGYPGDGARADGAGRGGASRTRRCASSPTRAGSPSSAAAARTAATGGSRRGCCARRAARRSRPTRSRAATS